MENTFHIADLPDGAECNLMITSPDPKCYGPYFLRLYKGSPLRQLLERHEIFEKAFREAVARKDANAGPS